MNTISNSYFVESGTDETMPECSRETNRLRTRRESRASDDMSPRKCAIRGYVTRRGRASGSDGNIGTIPRKVSEEAQQASEPRAREQWSRASAWSATWKALTETVSQA